MHDVALTLWTDDPQLARAADRAGVERIGVDIERIGKAERQAGTCSRFSLHAPEALVRVRRELRGAVPFARCNRLHEGSRLEIDRLLAYGARVVMLPYFRKLGEVRAFVELLAGRAVFVALVETVESLSFAEELVNVPGIDEVHFGLNDLHLQLRLPTHFHVLQTREFRRAAAAVRDRGLPFGIGAIARPHDRSLPVHPLVMYRVLRRFGATRTLIARSFLTPPLDAAALARDVAEARSVLMWTGRKGVA